MKMNWQPSSVPYNKQALPCLQPDAIHIAAAHRLDATIVTLDRGMARAATALGVACINPAKTFGEQKD